MTNVMSKIESVILGMFFGLLPAVFCFLITGLVTAILYEPEDFGPWILWSLVPGVIIGVIFAIKLTKKAYQISNNVLAAFYVFYSVVALGMGMGVPLLNFALGIAAGVYSARRMHFAGADYQTRKKYFKKTAVFCAVVMAMMCCLITLWAIAGQMIGYDVQLPYLSFTLTLPLFSAVVLTGGAILVVLQYWLTKNAAKVTGKLENKNMFAKILTVAAVLIAAAGVLALGWMALQCYRVNKQQATQQRIKGERFDVDKATLSVNNHQSI
jgi:hypothetical protein